jgi:membrane-associated phospholipid phosphatase
VSKLFFRNIFFGCCLCYFVVGGIFIYLYGKEETFLFFNRHYNPTLGQFYKYYTHIGDGFFIVALAIVFLFVKYYYTFFLMVLYIVPSILVQALKRIVFSTVSRPVKYFAWESELNRGIKLNLTEGVDVALTNSFPSGHTASAFALFFFLSIIIENTYLRFLFFVMAVNCAISRVYLCEHFYIDTFAGALLSIIICIPLIYLLENGQMKQKLNGSLLRSNK